MKKPAACLLLVAFLTGCATHSGGSSPYYNAGHTVRLNKVYGSPVSGTVRINANQQGVSIQPGVTIDRLRIPTK